MSGPGGGRPDIILVEHVTKRFGDVAAVDDVSLAIRENEFFALLGPSGCGKTTLLRMLAGFETPDAGRLLLDGRDLVGIPPHRRPLNMMFQSYALFPHMTVAENVGYGLRMDRVPRPEIGRRVDEALELVQLGGHAGRRPHQLSGGQRQRVALARALIKRPRVLLLDEPLAALDRQIRLEMQLELKRLQHGVGITFVVVTHDQEEALALADRIAVMRHGRVVQVGPSGELYERPTSPFVATFLGESNVFRGTLHLGDGRPALVDGPFRLPLPPDDDLGARAANGDRVALVVRPERVELRERAGPGTRDLLDGEDGTLSGTVVETIYLGDSVKVVVELAGGRQLLARTSVRDARRVPAAGSPVQIGWSPGDALVVADD